MWTVILKAIKGCLEAVVEVLEEYAEAHPKWAKFASILTLIATIVGVLLGSGII